MAIRSFSSKVENTKGLTMPNLLITNYFPIAIGIQINNLRLSLPMLLNRTHELFPENHTHTNNTTKKGPNYKNQRTLWL